MVEWNGTVVSINRKFLPKIEVNENRKEYRLRLSPKYIDFMDSISNFCRKKIKKHNGYVDLFLVVYFKRNFDTDNFLKPFCDALKKALVIEDDKFIRNIYVKRYYSEYGKDDIIKFELKEVQN